MARRLESHSWKWKVPTQRYCSSTRHPAEVVCGFGTPTAPEGVEVYNPAFDVTPAALITAIVSDRGIHVPPLDITAVRDESEPHSVAARTLERVAS